MYEERFGPVARRWRRMARAVRWRVKGALHRRRTILVEMRWRLGDEIMALPVYSALKRAHPEAAVTVWSTYPELLAGNAGVDAVNRDVDPDRYILLRDAARDVHRIEHYARLAGIPVPDERPRVVAGDPQPGDWQATEGRRIVLAPGATWPTKRWPRDRWHALAERLIDDGFEVVVLGLDGEGIGAGRDCTGRTSVADCARILTAADLCVASDSGLMHLALAVDTPVVALFGPTNPRVLVDGDPRLRVVTNERPCRYCWNDSQEMTHPGVCPRGIPGCLSTISIDRVDENIRNALRTRNSLPVS